MQDVVYLYCVRASTRLSVIRCAYFESKEKDDWRRTTIFHTLTKIGGKICKVIVDNGSCIIVMSSKVIDKIGFKVVPHPYPCNVS